MLYNLLFGLFEIKSNPILFHPKSSPYNYRKNLQFFFFFFITKRTYMIKCNPSSPYIVPGSKTCQPSRNKRYASSLCLEYYTLRIIYFISLLNFFITFFFYQKKFTRYVLLFFLFFFYFLFFQEGCFLGASSWLFVFSI